MRYAIYGIYVIVCGVFVRQCFSCSPRFGWVMFTFRELNFTDIYFFTSNARFNVSILFAQVHFAQVHSERQFAGEREK